MDKLLYDEDGKTVVKCPQCGGNLRRVYPELVFKCQGVCKKHYTIPIRVIEISKKDFAQLVLKRGENL